MECFGEVLIWVSTCLFDCKCNKHASETGKGAVNCRGCCLLLALDAKMDSTPPTGVQLKELVEIGVASFDYGLQKKNTIKVAVDAN